MSSKQARTKHNMPVTKFTRTFSADDDTVEKLMKTALRPCYIGGQLNQLRRNRNDEVTMGDALLFKGTGRDSYYVERLAAMAERTRDEGGQVKKSVSYLLQFARRACRLYRIADLDRVVSRFRDDYMDALRQKDSAEHEADAAAHGGWLAFLGDDVANFVECPHAPGTEEHADWVEEHRNEMAPV